MVPTAESEDAAENSGILADGEKGGAASGGLSGEDGWKNGHRFYFLLP